MGRSQVSKELSKLKKRADTIWSKYIRYRDGEVKNGEWQSLCITCQQWKPLKSMQCGHFVSRTCNLLRYDEENTNAQCVGCNMFKGGEQYEYARQLDLKYGDGTAEKLHNQRHINHKLTITELEQIINEAKEYTDELEEL
jgi:hypothetical protein